MSIKIRTIRGLYEVLILNNITGIDIVIEYYTKI